MALVLITEDLFNRSNSTTGLGTSSTGIPWESISGEYGIISNRAYRVSPLGSNAVVTLQANRADVTVESDIILGASGNVDVGFGLRVANSSNMLLVSGVLRTGENRISIYSIVNNSYSVIAELTSANFVAGSTYALKAAVIGNTIQVWRDNQSILGPITIPAAAMTATGNATKHGLRSANEAGNSRWDNFRILYDDPGSGGEPTPGANTLKLYVMRDGVLVGPCNQHVLRQGLPGNTVLPVINGTIISGQTMTATVGAWSSANSVSGQWVRLDSSFGGGNTSSYSGTITSIAGATSTTYTLTSSDIGKYIAYKETATNGVGSVEVMSASRGPITTSVDPGGDQYWASSRSVWQYPFHHQTIWYRPIGSDAIRVNAQLQHANAGNSFGGARAVTLDEDIFDLGPSFPVRTLTVTDSNTSTSGTQVMVPGDLDHDGTLNGCAAFQLASDPYKIFQGQPLTLVRGGQPKWKHTIRETTPVHLKTDIDRARQGSHGGSALSTVGGTIRLGELVGSEPIHHVLKMNLYGWRFISRTNEGKRWPAYVADGNYLSTSTSGGYNGSVPALRMGALLALPANFDLNTVTNPKTKKIAEALIYYGAYVVDNTAWDVHAFNVNIYPIRNGEWPRVQDDPSFHLQLQNVITQLQVIDNNEPGQTCSGGGSPLRSRLFAPPTFSN